MKALMVLNVLFPIVLPIPMIRYSLVVLDPQSTEKIVWDEIAYEVAFLGVGILQIVSGIILVQGIVKVRLFFVNKGAEDSMDTKNHIIHSLSFILYLLAGCVYYVMFSIHVFQPKLDVAWTHYFEAGIAMYSANFLAQILLVIVFWELGKKEQELPDTATECSEQEPEVEGFDEDAEMQARIWNSFNRDRLHSRGRENSGRSSNSSQNSFLV